RVFAHEARGQLVGRGLAVLLEPGLAEGLGRVEVGAGGHDHVVGCPPLATSQADQTGRGSTRDQGAEQAQRLAPGMQLLVAHWSLPSRWSAMRMASATMVKVGLAAPEVGNNELPATSKLATPWT